MPETIEQYLIDQFSDQVHHNASQVKSRLRPHVLQKMVTGSEFSYNTIGSGEAHEVTTRHAQTKIDTPTHGVRWGKMRHFTKTFLLDDWDARHSLVNPENGYAEQLARAMYRKADRVILEALVADVVTGRDKDTTVTAADDGVVTIAHGSAGATFDKLSESMENFYNNEIGTDLEEHFIFACTGTQNRDMIDESKLGNQDYNHYFQSTDGKMNKALEYDVAIFGSNVANPMLSVDSNIRDCIGFAARGVCLGISKEAQIQATIRGDLNNALQIQASMYMGAVRTEGELVQIVKCQES